MRKTWALLGAGILIAILSVAGAGVLTAKVSGKEAPAFRPEDIRAHVKFLSSDLLEGRGTGARGGDIAADYIATQFDLDGLKPAGDGGTYFQRVPMVGVETMPDTTFQLVPDKGEPLTLKNLDEYVVNNERQTEIADIDAPIVFVGFGIRAPEYKWDDYKGEDMKGKVALIFVNEPPSNDPNFFKGKALTYYGRWMYKFEEAPRMGAVGALVIHRSDLASYGWQVVRNSMGKERSFQKLDGAPKLEAASWVQWDVAQKIVGMAGLNLDQLYEQAQSRNFKPIELPVHLKAHIVSELHPFVSRNVVAKLEGSDPNLTHQAVMYTAHYDHLGIDPSLKGDKIFNGAVDNGTGCGILLELARVWAASPARPKRSIFFVSVTAEEQGLLGSEYFGKHPPIPDHDISLDLNYDALAPIGIPQEVEVTGAERTTFYPVVEEVAKDFGLAIRPDSQPGAGHYYRSDHFSMARVGVPGFSISEGVKYEGHDLAWGEAQAADYVKNHYHQPSDEFQPDWDFAGLAKMASFGYELGLKAADQPAEVQWQPGDEFEAARKLAEK
ncbi:MAG TPA: M28 family peptidase [Terriglobales bacterium]|nr:M28 family peptidase [Terriglobales bacterium]